VRRCVGQNRSKRGLRGNGKRTPEQHEKVIAIRARTSKGRRVGRVSVRILPFLAG
jgi:hypothetical protein